VTVYRRIAAGAVALLAVGLLAWLASPAAALDRLSALTTSPLAYGALLVAVSAVRPFLAWPTTLLSVAVGFGFGWVGLPLALALVTLTALPPYYLAKRGGGATGRIGRASERVVAAGGGGLRTVAASRLLPTPSDAISVGAGVAGVRVRPFLAGTAVGELPWVLAGVAVGISAERLVAGDLSGVFDPHLLLGGAAAGLLLLAGPLYRSVRGDVAASVGE